jgi:hypothetical protein
LFDSMPCKLMAVQRRFGGIYYFYIQIRRLSQPSDQMDIGGEEYLTRKMKALRTSETLNFYWTTRCHISGNCRKKLESYAVARGLRYFCNQYCLRLWTLISLFPSYLLDICEIYRSSYEVKTALALRTLERGACLRIDFSFQREFAQPKSFRNKNEHLRTKRKRTQSLPIR